MLDCIARDLLFPPLYCPQSACLLHIVGLDVLATYLVPGKLLRDGTYP